MKRLLLLFFCFLFAGAVRAADYRFERDILYRTDASGDYARRMCRLDVACPPDAEDAPVVVWFHGGGLTGGKRAVPEGLMKGVRGRGRRVSADPARRDARHRGRCRGGRGVGLRPYRRLRRRPFENLYRGALRWRLSGQYGGVGPFAAGALRQGCRFAGGHHPFQRSCHYAFRRAQGIGYVCVAAARRRHCAALLRAARLCADADSFGRPRVGDERPLRGDGLFLADDAARWARGRDALRVRRL